MAELKTKPNQQSVTEFLNSVEDAKKREDSFAVLEMMKSISKDEPVMWGSSIVGFGTYHYKYASGTEGDWMKIGFAPRKQAITLYIMSGFSEYESLLKKLGKYKTGKSCLYIKDLLDIDRDILKELIKQSIASISKRYA